jgi:hypothetical protein
MAKKKKRKPQNRPSPAAVRPGAETPVSAGKRPAGAPPRRSVPEGKDRQARKEEVRARREQIRKAQARRAAFRRALVPAVITLVVVGAFEIYQAANRTTSPTTAGVYVSPSGSPVDPTTLPGVQTGNAPWTPATDTLKARLTAIGLPALTAEGQALHIHQHIDIFVNGGPVTVPAEIGLAPGLFSPIHTHDATGIIHVESPTIRDFTLGEFFDVWGVRFTQDCIGAYCSSGSSTLKVYVDGKLTTGGDPRNLKLFAHEEIAIVFGTPPSPIPSSYTFPAGL